MIQPRLLEVPDLLKVPDSMPVSVPFEKDNMAAAASSGSLSLQISSAAPSSGPGSGPWLEEKEDVDIAKYIEGLEDQVQVVPGSPPSSSSSAPPCRGLKRSFGEGQFMTPSPPEEVKKKKK